MPLVSVNIKKNASVYSINISSGIAEKIIETYKDAGGFFIIDKNVANLYKEMLPINNVYIFDACERNKSLVSVEKMLLWLKDNGALRDSRLVAIGGGVTGDTSGFAAAVYMRGIKFIQIPTTLLAMVDSSIGGKTGVNFGGLKNSIGAFHQPSEVIIDTRFLETLTEHEFLNGLAEAVKISCIYGTDFFHFIKNEKLKILKRNQKVLESLIEQSCLLKAKIVERDEKEGGLRKLLNFGHTIAHAIEIDSKHRIAHGFAVAIGIVYESAFALENGYTDKKTFKQIKNIIECFGYPSSYSPEDEKIFTNALLQDKKTARDGISLAFAGSDLIGKIVDGVNPADLAEFIFKYKDGYK